MKKQALPIEHSLFTFEGWDGDHGCMMFCNCTVIKPFGPYKVGDKLDSVHLVYEASRIEVYPETEVGEEYIPEWVGTLSLQVND